MSVALTVDPLVAKKDNALVASSEGQMDRKTAGAKVASSDNLTAHKMVGLMAGKLVGEMVGSLAALKEQTEAG